MLEANHNPQEMNSMKRQAHSLVVILLVAGGAALIPINVRGDDDRLIVLGTRLLGAYDAEYHIGLVADNPSDDIAQANADKLNLAMAQMWPGGTFDFAHGAPGPVIYPIHFAAKRFYFKGKLQTGLRSGGELAGAGGGSAIGNGEFNPLGNGGQQTQFVRIDPPDPEEPEYEPADDFVFLLRNNGTTLRNIFFYGRRLTGNINSGTGLRTGCGIGMEARNTQSTGKHVITNCGVVDCITAIHFLSSYYNEDGTYHAPGDAHADNTTWIDFRSSGCDVGILSENDQAVWHRFLGISGLGTTSGGTVLKVVAGGLWKFDFLSIGINSTLLEVADGDVTNSYSQNTSRFDIHFVRDGFANLDSDPETPGVQPTPGRQRVTLFRYAGTLPADHKKWDVRITGNIAGSQAEFNSDPTTWVDLSGLTQRRTGANIYFDINNLPPHIAAPFWPNGAYRISTAERANIVAEHLREGTMIYDTDLRRLYAWSFDDADAGDLSGGWEILHILPAQD
ncbi:MAG: hypothetical protein WD669_04175 [Pirellulales bacterium]